MRFVPGPTRLSWNCGRNRRQELWEARDPEFGNSIIERELVDAVEIGRYTVRVLVTSRCRFVPSLSPCTLGGRSAGGPSGCRSLDA